MNDEQTHLRHVLEVPVMCETCGATVYPDGTVSEACSGECDREINVEAEFAELDFSPQTSLGINPPVEPIEWTPEDEMEYMDEEDYDLAEAHYFTDINDGETDDEDY